MGFLIIGSTALKHWFPETREPKDRDYLTTSAGPFTDQMLGGDTFSHVGLNEYLIGCGGYASVDELYTLKVSHSHWELKNGSWGKHMKDILFLQEKGAKLIPELYKMFYDVWVDVHGKKKMTFSEAEDFFDDAVVRKYDHDSIHESVAYGDHALYADFLLPDRSVAMDMGKVWSSPHETLVRMFREEIYATALERLVIPRDYRISPGFAYHWALRRTITSLTKGKSSLWLIENFRDFKDAKDPYTKENYVERHLRKSDKLIPLSTLQNA